MHTHKSDRRASVDRTPCIHALSACCVILHSMQMLPQGRRLFHSVTTSHFVSSCVPFVDRGTPLCIHMMQATVQAMRSMTPNVGRVDIKVLSGAGWTCPV